jgi:hypothetical protein
VIGTDRWRSEPPCVYPPAKRATWPNGEWEYSTCRHMLEPVRPGAVLPDRALCLPTFSHFLIVIKSSFSLPPPPALSFCLSVSPSPSPPPSPPPSLLPSLPPFLPPSLSPSVPPRTGLRLSLSLSRPSAPATLLLITYLSLPPLLRVRVLTNTSETTPNEHKEAGGVHSKRKAVKRRGATAQNTNGCDLLTRKRNC